ncbi:hypothetical protein SH467x_003660 [Pirellulaceae bacterium SH467]
MKIDLELIDATSRPAVFRVAYYDADSRYLLQYPRVCGLRFFDLAGNLAAEWGARFLVSAPLDDFVLAPKSRIAFDLYASINPEPSAEAFWSIMLPNGDYSVKFEYHVDRDTDWYDFLAKRSRFAGITPIWRGTKISNSVSITITEGKLVTAI